MTPEEEKKAKQKLYYETNKERILLKNKEYKKLNSGKIKEDKKQYREANNEKIRQYANEYRNQKKKTDPVYRLKENIRNTIKKSIKKLGFKKLSHTEQIIGCTFDEFKLYIEAQFNDFMNWDNYGFYNGKPNFGWDIDHIIPLSRAKCEAEIIKLNHYSNLQPLCSYTNRVVKKDK